MKAHLIRIEAARSDVFSPILFESYEFFTSWLQKKKKCEKEKFQTEQKPFEIREKP